MECSAPIELFPTKHQAFLFYSSTIQAKVYKRILVCHLIPGLQETNLKLFSMYIWLEKVFLVLLALPIFTIMYDDLKLLVSYPGSSDFDVDCLYFPLSILF